jgi:hypothetical protein
MNRHATSALFYGAPPMDWSKSTAARRISDGPSSADE